MGYKIPEDWDIIRAVEYVLKRRKFVDSNEKLAYLVLKRLNQKDNDYVVSAERVKKIALDIPEVRVRTKTRRSKKVKKLKNCPVCENKISWTYRKNLKSQKIHTGYRCKKCGFMTDKSSLRPMRYVFVWKNDH